MEKILLLLLVAGGLFSQLEAKCTWNDLANLRGKGFSTTDIDRMCGTSHTSKSHHPKHKKRKKHHRRAGGRLQLVTVTSQQCFRYSGRKQDGCYLDVDVAKQVCHSVGAKLPTLHQVQKIGAQCGLKVSRYGNDQEATKSQRSCLLKKGIGTDGETYWLNTRGNFNWHMSVNFLWGVVNTVHLTNHVICVK